MNGFFILDQVFHIYPNVEAADRMGFRSIMSVPLLHEGRSIGTIGVARRSPGLFALPPALLGKALSLLGQKNMARRLLSPLVVAPATLLASGWSPQVPAGQALAAMAQRLAKEG